MKTTTMFLTIAIATALSAPAFAQGGNITGSEYAGEPINSSVRSPAKNPETGLTPGGEAAHGKAFVKHQKKLRSGRAAKKGTGSYAKQY